MQRNIKQLVALPSLVLGHELAYKNGSGVFINKLGIENGESLNVAEYLISAYRSNELANGMVELPKGHGLERLQAIHKHLFQDVYEWAGQTRTVPSSKHLTSNTKIVSRFAESDTIQSDWQALEKKTQDFIEETQHLNLERIRDALVVIFVEANRIHAFLEGNGRSLQVFMKLLAQKKGVSLDYTKTSPQEWNRACALSGTHGQRFENLVIPQIPNTEPIKKIFAGMAQLNPIRETEVGVLNHDDRGSPAVLFERAERGLALRAYPDLASAYNALDAVKEGAVNVGLKDKQLEVFMKSIRIELSKQLDKGVRTFDHHQVSLSVAPLLKIVIPKMKM